MEAVKTKPTTYWTPGRMWAYLKEIGVTLHPFEGISCSVEFPLRTPAILMRDKKPRYYPQMDCLNTRIVSDNREILNVMISLFVDSYSKWNRLKIDDNNKPHHVNVTEYKNSEQYKENVKKAKLQWDRHFSKPMYHPDRFWKYSPDRFSRANDLKRQQEREQKKRRVI